jgi:UDP-N-acetylglucosamine 1-carboxyvinyltransferase
MTKIRIEGGKGLYGTIKIDGAKNAILPILAGCLLTRGKTVLYNVPKISDITNMLHILSSLGCAVTVKNDILSIEVNKITKSDIDTELGKKIRGSVFIMGALLARTKTITLPYPGGCAIGNRPIDIHTDALRKIGVKIKESKSYLRAMWKQTNAAKMKELFFDFPSVGATENLILATALGNKTYKFVGVAKEPEIIDLCNFLNSCGANITGAGTDTITVAGVGDLHGCEYIPIPDRINTGSYLIAAAAAGGDVTLQNVIPQHNGNLISKLKLLGAKINVPAKNTLRIVCSRPTRRFACINIHTAPYPGFPTDLQSQFAVLAAITKGQTTITETLFENRFRYADELAKLGAKITVRANKAVITGVPQLSALSTPNICPEAYITASRINCDGIILNAADLRGGVALVIAGLCAKGTATIENAEYIYRGHADIVKDLSSLGANIIRID